MKLSSFFAPTGALALIVVGSAITMGAPASATDVVSSPVTATTSAAVDVTPAPTLTAPDVPAQAACTYAAVWGGSGGVIEANGPGATCSNPLYVNLALWQFRGVEKFPQDLVVGSPLTIDKPGTYQQALDLAVCQQLDWYASFSGPVNLPAVLEGGNEPAFVSSTVRTVGGPTYNATAHDAATCAPPTEEPSSTPTPSSTPSSTPTSTPPASSAPPTSTPSSTPTTSAPSPSSTATHVATATPVPSTIKSPASGTPSGSVTRTTGATTPSPQTTSDTGLAYTGSSPLPTLIVGLGLLGAGLAVAAAWALAPRLRRNRR